MKNIEAANKEQKYSIELTKREVELLSWACDTFSRIICGQSWSIQDILEQAWEKRAKEATENFMDKEFDGGWDKMREETNKLCDDIKKKYWGLGGNSQYGIHYDNTADFLFDCHQVLRHQLWLDDSNKNKSRSTVDAYEAMQVSDLPLVKIKKL